MAKEGLMLGGAHWLKGGSLDDRVCGGSVCGCVGGAAQKGHFPLQRKAKLDT